MFSIISICILITRHFHFRVFDVVCMAQFSYAPFSCYQLRKGFVLCVYIFFQNIPRLPILFKHILQFHTVIN